MDILKAEIAAKKRKAPVDDAAAPSAQGIASASSSSSKYLRRGEEEARQRRERQEKEAADKRARIEQIKEDEQRQVQRAASRSKSATPDRDAKASGEREVFNISSEEAIRRLRSKGEPIRLFGESDKERRLRLRALELIEERGEKVGQNDFLRAMQGQESKMLTEQLEGKTSDGRDATRHKEKDTTAMAENSREDGKAQESAASSEKREGVGMDSVLDLELLKKDIGKVYPLVYYTLKGLMQDWEQTLAERPIEVRQSSQGKLVAATQLQTAENMRPLFKLLRKREIKPDILARIAEIVHHIQKREYRMANDSYLRLSIGNATWPIGVTMVGIHERSGREKIFSSNVAHVLNDEVSRKYIQSLKRLMTFAQTRYPPEDVSMLMG